MTKAQFKKQKERELKKIMRQQLSLIMKAAKISIIPTKRASTALRRAGKVVAIGLQIKMLEMQKQMVIARPYPKFPSGDSAIVGETSPELIVTPNGFINVPATNHHPDPN